MENTKKQNFLVKWLKTKETTVLFILIGIIIILSILSPHFLTKGNLITVLIGLSADGIITIAMTVILAMGGIDLSVGLIMGFSAMLVAKLADLGVNLWVGALVALVGAFICGMINGVFIAKFKLTPFIMTLAMMSIVKGITLVVTSGRAVPLPRDNKAFLFLGQGYVANAIPFIVLIFVVIAVVMHILLTKSELFRKVYYIGSNEKAAKLSGIKVDSIKIFVYILSGVLCGLAGVLSVSRFSTSTPSTGVGVEMTAISAAVIGGSSLNGGIGSVYGAVLGILLLNIVNNGLVLLDVSVYAQDLISGAILLAAVTLDVLSSKKRAV